MIASVPKTYPYIVNPQHWVILQRTLNAAAVSPLAGGGIRFDLNVAPQPDPNARGTSFDDYLIMQQPADASHPPLGKAPIKGKSLVFEVEVVASPGTVFNFMSDPDNTGTAPAAAHAYIQKNTIGGAGVDERWWCFTKIWPLQNGKATMVCPLDPSQWSDVDGHHADETPELTAAFNAVVQAPIFIGLTLGGGLYYGHGVNVSNGTAQFRLHKAYSSE